MIRIDVTAEDIQLGIRRSFRCCPVALAARRELGRHGFVVSGCETHGLRLGVGYVELPYDAMKFVDAFDRDDAVEPFSFEVRDPDLEATADGN